MNSSNQPQSLPPEGGSPDRIAANSMRSLRVIFVAMFSSVVLCALLGTFLRRDLVASDYDIRQVYRIFSFLGGVLVAVLLLLRNLINRVLQPPEGEGEQKPEEVSKRLARFFILSIVAFAVSEAIAILGLIFALMGGTGRTLYFFCGVALACLILFFPRPLES